MPVALPSMPKTPGLAEPKLDVPLAVEQALPVFSAPLSILKTLEPIKAAQQPTALSPHRRVPQLAEPPLALQVSYPRREQAVQKPSPHPPSR
jgi:hypothetical protein